MHALVDAVNTEITEGGLLVVGGLGVNTVSDYIMLYPI